MWTQFSDAHSGGNSKTHYEDIFIEAPEKQALVIFTSVFGHNPSRDEYDDGGVSENDYNIYERETLDDHWVGMKTLSEYKNVEWTDFARRQNVRIIRRDQILDAIGV